jgi:hypothetical protein
MFRILADGPQGWKRCTSAPAWPVLLCRTAKIG